MIIKSKPIIIAHRGASGVAPENTLSAFRLAKGIGVDGIELDIHLSADGQIVVIHDYEINRTAQQKLDAPILVEDLTLRQLRKYDSGNGEKIPTLKQAMDLIGTDILLDIEIKANKGKPYKKLCVALALFLYNRDNIKNVFVSSFNPFALNAFRRATNKLKMKIPTALIYANDPQVPPVLRFGHGRFFHRPDILKPYYKNIQNRKNLTGRKPMLAWTVDDTKIAKDLFDKNVAGVITNMPDKILKAR